MNNVELAILSMVNELAGRYGLSPCEFIARIRSNPETGECTLCYESPVFGDVRREKRFLDMMESAVGSASSSELTGELDHIYGAINNAIRSAPRQRARS